VSGAIQGTAATGTTGLIVKTTADTFFPGHVGNSFANTGAQILTYVGPREVHTDIAHGYLIGTTITIQPGDLTWEGTISHSAGWGIQFLDSSATLKQTMAHRCDFTRSRIFDNLADLQDIGGGTTHQVTRASGQAPATLTDNLVSGSQFDNPFPMDMWVYNAVASGVTSLRGRHPKDVPVSTGINSGPFLVKAGGSIIVNNVLASNVRWVFA